MQYSKSILTTALVGFAAALLVPVLMVSLIVKEAQAQNGSPTTDLASLKWMAGTWIGVEGKAEMEEHWLPPKGNTMLGLHRDVVGGRTVMFEFLRIEATADAITYWASPKGRPATSFKLKESRENYALFENPEHDFPQRIIYWLDKDGALHAKIEGTQGGKASSAEWTWKRQ